MRDRLKTVKSTSGQEVPHPDPDPNAEPLWTVQDVAEFLRLEPETVRAMAREGKLPGIKVGRAWRFKKITVIKQLDLG